MAFKLLKDLNTGFTSDHWELINMELDFVNDVGVALLGLYKDKAAKDAGKLPVTTESVRVSGITSNQKVIAFKAQVLTKVKTFPEFAGAVDE